MGILIGILAHCNGQWVEGAWLSSILDVLHISSVRILCWTVTIQHVFETVLRNRRTQSTELAKEPYSREEHFAYNGAWATHAALRQQTLLCIVEAWSSMELYQSSRLELGV